MEHDLKTELIVANEQLPEEIGKSAITYKKMYETTFHIVCMVKKYM
ncbi:hypothetical protein [Bacillus alveayuensis]|nr:hypothetical protein [Bacillus alveayuensis]